MKLSITGVGWTTAAGIGRGRQTRQFSMPEGPLPVLTRKAVFDTPYQHFGRLDQFSKLGLASISMALKDAGKNTGIELRDMAIIVSTTYGCSQTDLDYFDTVMTDGGKSASPALFSYTLPNSFLGEASCRFGLTGASFVVNEFPPMGLSGLKAAMDGISFNEFENALVGFCEPGCPSGFENNSGTAPGALFFLIDRIEKSVHPPFGTVELNSRNDVLFNGKQIRDLLNLARECLLVKC